MLDQDPVRKTLIMHFSLLIHQGQKYITPEEYDAGVRYQLFSTGHDPETKAATAEFRGHLFTCPSRTYEAA